MAETTSQNYGNHVRWDPVYHFFAVPVMLLLFLGTLTYLIWKHHLHTVIVVVVAAALVVIALKARLYALKAQDRVIRLEERLRLATLLAEPLRSRIGELNEGQLIALRFASDGEIPALVEKTLREKTAPKEIKKSIQNWRADTFRV